MEVSMHKIIAALVGFAGGVLISEAVAQAAKFWG